MGAWRLVLIECDAIACDRHFNSITDDYGQARRDAAQRGWIRDEDADEDYCPDHGEA